MDVKSKYLAYYLVSSFEIPTTNGSLDDSWNCLPFLCCALSECEGCVWVTTMAIITSAVTLPPNIAGSMNKMSTLSIAVTVNQFG